MSYADRANNVLIDGVGTFSKRWDQFVEGVYPTHCVSQMQEWIRDTYGREFIDWVGALGANMCGTDVSHSLPHVAEVELGDKLNSRISTDSETRGIGPFKYKFLREGSSACVASIRYARTINKQNTRWVWGCGYHGYQEHFISVEEPGLGCIPQDYRKFASHGDMIDVLTKTPNEGLPCAVIVEPLQLDYNGNAMLETKILRELCFKKNILFIADEIITGGRVPDFVISKHWDLDPDMICMGKALGMGHPLGIIGVHKRYDVTGAFVSTTFAGSLPSIDGAIEYLDMMDDTMLKVIWDAGEILTKNFNNLSLPVKYRGYPTRGTWVGDPADIALFWQEMLKRGHLLGRAYFTTTCNYHHIPTLLEDAAEVAQEWSNLKLEGIPPRPIFRRD